MHIHLDSRDKSFRLAQLHSIWISCKCLIEQEIISYLLYWQKVATWSTSWVILWGIIDFFLSYDPFNQSYINLLKSQLFVCFWMFQGKTLAFVLPILESLTNGVFKGSRKTGYGRSPSVLVLLPTRELATQVICEDLIPENFYRTQISTILF